MNTRSGYYECMSKPANLLPTSEATATITDNIFIRKQFFRANAFQKGMEEGN